MEKIINSACKIEDIQLVLSHQIQHYVNDGFIVSYNTCYGTEKGCLYRVDLAGRGHDILYRIALTKDHKICEGEKYDVLTLTVNRKDITCVDVACFSNSDFNYNCSSKRWVKIGECSSEPRYIPAECLPLWAKAKAAYGSASDTTMLELSTIVGFEKFNYYIRKKDDYNYMAEYAAAHPAYCERVLRHISSRFGWIDETDKVILPEVLTTGIGIEKLQNYDIVCKALSEVFLSIELYGK